MEELKFVIKCLCITMLLVILMQIKIGGASIEAHSLHWLRISAVSHYIQSVAAGGAMAMRNLGVALKQGISSTVDGFNEGSHQKAIR